ncbi:MAG: hypothetical protein ACPL8I_15620 [Chloroflexaceae bacterium]
MDTISIIAIIIGVGMIGGAFIGWVVALALIVNELVAPQVQEVFRRRRDGHYPARSQTTPGY